MNYFLTYKEKIKQKITWTIKKDKDLIDGQTSVEKRGGEKITDEGAHHKTLHL